MDCQLEQAQQWTDCWGNISVATNVTITCNTLHTRGQSVSGWSLDGQLHVHHDRQQGDKYYYVVRKTVLGTRLQHQSMLTLAVPVI